MLLSKEQGSKSVELILFRLISGASTRSPRHPNLLLLAIVSDRFLGQDHRKRYAINQTETKRNLFREVPSSSYPQVGD